MVAEIQQKLQHYYRQKFPGGAKVGNLTAINAGWESVIYAFGLDAGQGDSGQSRDMILRIYPGDDAYQKSLREFEGMRHLYDLGYPVPKVYTLEREASPFGRPFVLMERIEGEILWHVIDRSTPEVCAGLLSRFCELFVQLHALDWRVFIPETERAAYEVPYIFVDRYLEWLHSAAELYPQLTTFFPFFEWLEERREQVSCYAPAPVHWDFHPGNLILEPDGSIKVIDWTQIQASDPRFDLAWTLLLVGAYMGTEVRGFILDQYQRLSGRPVEQLDYFDVANAVKRLGSMMISLSEGADKVGMRPDAVSAMQRDFAPLRWVYNLMVERTGIALPDVERFLEM